MNLSSQIHFDISSVIDIINCVNHVILFYVESGWAHLSLAEREGEGQRKKGRQDKRTVCVIGAFSIGIRTYSADVMDEGMT